MTTKETDLRAELFIFGYIHELERRFVLFMAIPSDIVHLLSVFIETITYTVLGIGSNEYLQLGLPVENEQYNYTKIKCMSSLIRYPKQISCGYYRFNAILPSSYKVINSWGYNEYFQYTENTTNDQQKQYESPSIEQITITIFGNIKNRIKQWFTKYAIQSMSSRDFIKFVRSLQIRCKKEEKLKLLRGISSYQWKTVLTKFDISQISEAYFLVMAKKQFGKMLKRTLPTGYIIKLHKALRTELVIIAEKRVFATKECIGNCDNTEIIRLLLYIFQESDIMDIGYYLDVEKLNELFEEKGMNGIKFTEMDEEFIINNFMKKCIRYKTYKLNENCISLNVNLRKDEYITVVSNGLYNTLFVTNKNRVYGTGFNTKYQLGIENRKWKCYHCHSFNDMELTNYCQKCHGSSTESVVSIRSLELMSLQTINERIIDIRCGESHTLLLGDYGSVWSMGSNEFYQCGVDKQKDDDYIIKTPMKIPFDCKIIDIGCGKNHSLCVSDNNDLWVFGLNKHNQCGVNNEDPDIMSIQKRVHNYFKWNNINIIKVTSKWEHSLCIDINGYCYLFGNNSHGQVCRYGDGSDLNVPYLFQNGKHFKNVKISDGSTSKDHTVLLDEGEDRIYTFGNNNYKQCTNDSKDIINTPYELTISDIINEDTDKDWSNIVRVIAGFQCTVLVCQ